MIEVALSAVVALIATAELGSPLQQDAYTLRPPARFRMARRDLFHGTRAGAVSQDPRAQRFLSAALVDAEGADAAAMIVSVVDGTFEASPSARDAFSTAVVRHFADELGMPMSLERAELVREVAPRVEVRGTVKQQEQVRTVLVSGMEGEGRHVVVIFSAPSGKFEELAPAMRASLDSFRMETNTPAVSRSVAGALSVVFALALFLSWSVWRRRRRMRRADLGLPG